MNTEKLDSLASQAGFDVERLRAPHPGGFPREDMLALESFAELIVRECIGCCEQVISDPVPKSVDTFEQGGIHCMDEIKQHFGVEE